LYKGVSFLRVISQEDWDAHRSRVQDETSREMDSLGEARMSARGRCGWCAQRLAWRWCSVRL